MLYGAARHEISLAKATQALARRNLLDTSALARIVPAV
jgi:hypothetical protein